MPLKGECLACSKINSCSETSVSRVKTSYTCSLFSAVPEPVYLARVRMMNQYGDDVAIEAMMDRLPNEDTENEDGDDDGDD